MVYRVKISFEPICGRYKESNVCRQTVMAFDILIHLIDKSFTISIVN